jgi:endonuclease/exonuclease/phosphatase family metal-dependent hydrolase
MKKLSLFDKLMLIGNLLLAIILIISYTSYYISPNKIPSIAIFSLTLPITIFANIFFILYWLLKVKKQFLISTIVLLIGFQYLNAFYNIREKKVILTNDIKIMSYNVRMFNLYNWIDKEGIDQKIYEFINQKSPDILCLQEFHTAAKIGFDYPYKYIKSREKNHAGQAIFSNYKIINSGSLNFSNTSNNSIFVDILKDNDTIRIYNVHLESLRINPGEEEFTQENSEKLRIRVEKAFKIQANQAALILNHQEQIKHKSIICGDFNNNAFSYVYKQLKKGKHDAFEKAGGGFGTTYDVKLPFRIDFIFTDKQIEINNFKTFDVNYSDHFPIMARVTF